MDGHDLLGIYLNDHLAGATAGTELSRRMAKAQAGAGAPTAATLRTVAAEIHEDRDALLEIMKELGVPVRRYRIAVGWAGEKAARLKPNGNLLHRSPLSSLLELETLRLGVEGKAAAWQALRELGDHDGGPDRDRLDTLLTRARAQAEALEELRVRRAAELFEPTAA